MKQIKLDKEEQGLLASYEHGEWQPIKNMAEEIARHREMAKKSFRKSKRINIRLVEQDLEKIQRYAMQEGIPYQTLISSILHKFANGRTIKA